VDVGRRGRAARRVRFHPFARSGHTHHRPTGSPRALIPSLPFERAVPHLIIYLSLCILQIGGTSVSTGMTAGLSPPPREVSDETISPAPSGREAALRDRLQ
jgi:hypothetical protein